MIANAIICTSKQGMGRATFIVRQGSKCRPKARLRALSQQLLQGSGGGTHVHPLPRPRHARPHHPDVGRRVLLRAGVSLGLGDEDVCDVPGGELQQPRQRVAAFRVCTGSSAFWKFGQKVWD